VATRTPALSPRALLLAAAIPILFLHAYYQPGFAVDVGSTSINAYLSDFAVLAVVLTGFAVGLQHGFGRLAQGRLAWGAAIVFFVWILVEIALGRRHDSGYPWHAHAVTAAKLVEYALLAPAVALIIRTFADLLVALWSLTLWSVFATGVGVAQFFGAPIFFAGTVARRQASFLSSGDFAALSCAVLLVGLVSLGFPRMQLGRRLAIVATTSGVLGTIIAGSLAGVLGVMTALVVLAAVGLLRRDLEVRPVALVASAGVIVLVGSLAIRTADLDAFARFVGASPGKQQAHPTKIQTYAHRTLLVWLGYKIWLDHPVLGVGFEGSAEPDNFEPYIPAAHHHFPDESPNSFPSRAENRRYGVQNLWVQALADLGVIGFLFTAAVFAAAAWLAARAALAGRTIGTIALAWTALLVWLFTAQGFIAGIPLDALTWLAFGLAAAPEPA
jgi:O-antigen ligase/polysaccharide polymerase Wzy-like membrane protein